MEQKTELLGSRIGAVMTACGSKVKEIIKYFKKDAVIVTFKSITMMAAIFTSI